MRLFETQSESEGRAAACSSKSGLKKTPSLFEKPPEPLILQLLPVGSPPGSVLQGLHPREGPHGTGNGRERGGEEEKCCGLTAAPVPPFPTRGEEVEVAGWGKALLVPSLCFSRP